MHEALSSLRDYYCQERCTSTDINRSKRLGSGLIVLKASIVTVQGKMGAFILNLTGIWCEIDRASPRGSRSTIYQMKRKQVENQKDVAKLSHIYRREVVQKCFINQDVLQEHDTFAIKDSFYGREKEATIMRLPKSMHALQKEEECMKVFSLIGLDHFFELSPCDINARRCHEFITML